MDITLLNRRNQGSIPCGNELNISLLAEQLLTITHITLMGRAHYYFLTPQDQAGFLYEGVTLEYPQR